MMASVQQGPSIQTHRTATTSAPGVISQNGGEGEALDAGAQAADVLRQRLGQHVDAPLHQVARRAPASSNKVGDMRCRLQSGSRSVAWYCL